MPSPSDCAAEVFWPESLKNYRDIVQKNPSLKSQNYLEALLASRQGQFPLEVTDSSLGVYLGLQGSSDLPSLPKGPALEVGRHASICTGSHLPDISGPATCEGLRLEWKNGDALLPLEGVELLSAEDLELDATGVLSQLPGAEAKGLTIRRGRLILSVRLSNPLWNAAIPFALPLPGVKISPNPHYSDLYDVDLTSIVLKKLPVAYRPDTRESVSYEAYQASSEPSHFKVLPYFLNIARSGAFPSQLSLNEVYRAVTELRANAKPAKEGEDSAQKALLEKLLDRIAVGAQLHPQRLIHENLYVEFNKDDAKNLFRTDFTLKRLKDWEALATAPLHLDRLFSPGVIDVVDLKADLGLYLHRQKPSRLAIDNLDIELGSMEYLSGLFALLGGRIHSTEDLFTDLALRGRALSVEGTAHGAQARMNVRLESLKLRLPGIGETTLSGQLQGQVRLVPKVETAILPSGETGEITRWVVEPGSIKLKLSELELRTAGGLHWQNAELEITDQSHYDSNLTTGKQGYLSLRFSSPEVEGGRFKSFAIEGGLPLVKGYDGLYDLKATLQDVATSLTLKAEKNDGLHENWTLNLQSRRLPGTASFGAELNGVQLTASGLPQRNPVENLWLRFNREKSGDGKTHYGLHLNADRIDFDQLDLGKVRVGLGLVEENPKPGVTRWTVPEFDVQANGSGWSKKGWIPGPVWLTSKATTEHPLSLEVDKNTENLDLRNLKLSFGVTGVRHPAIAQKSGGRIVGFDLDARLQGHWRMNYKTFKGQGLIALSGDGQGDLHLRGADGMPLSKPHPDDPSLLVGTPMLSHTQWRMFRTEGVDFENQWIKGKFRLDTLIDPAVARVFDFIFNNNLVGAVGFNHDHLPYTAPGFKRAEAQYLGKKAYGSKKERKGAEKP